MPKKRVNEIARELKIENKAILEKLSEWGINVKSHASSIEEPDIKRVMDFFSNTEKPKENKKPVQEEIKPADKVAAEEPKIDKSQVDKSLPPRPRPLGADGKPLPPRPRPLGPDGKPLPPRPRPIGADGKPLPPRPRPLGEDGKPLPPRPRPLGEDGKPLPRPRPLGPDGKPLPPRPRPLGEDGKPLPRPRPLGPDGKPLPPRPRPLGEDGKPLPRPRPIGEEGGQLQQPKPPQVSQNDEPITPKPQSQQSDRPNTPRPQAQQSDRPYTPRPQAQQSDRPYTPRPQAQQSDRPYTPRPQSQQGDRPYTPRPQGQQGDRPYTPRPQGQQGDRPYTPRPQGQQGDRPYTPRPQGQQGDRPYTPRPQGDRPAYGQRPPYQNRGGGFYDKDKDDRPQHRPAARNDRPSAPKIPIDKPDKHERQQKIEASKRVGKQEKIVEKRAEKLAPKPQQKQPVVPAEPKVIQIPLSLTLKELAEAMNKAGAEIVKFLMKKGQMIGINEIVDFDTASEIALEYNILVEEKVEIDILEEIFSEEPEDESVKIKRPPVVVVMGHVDHGKTSLLDAIRHTSVISNEAGGITQHIGAYTVAINDKPITFLDTPGHEAFTAMRMRGAQVTDIAILVVAADDGVMPQTIEAISHAKAAGIEIIVAINKIDKPSANPDRVKQELTEHGLVAEEWGGETICVPVSAATKVGIDTLLEMIILVSEMKEYKANPNKRARGTVIEACLEKGRGPVATVLIQDGTLEVGDSIVAGTTYGKVRAMMDDKGRRLKKAGPSIPVEILGLSEAPKAGDLFHVAINDKQARHVAQNIFAKGRVELIKETPQKVSLEDLFTQIQAGNVKDLNIIVKADVQGSVEAVKDSLEKLSNEEVRIRIILGGVGAITESDVMLAAASNAIIIGFNVRPEAMAKSIADEQEVDIRLYKIIYKAIEDIQAAMKGMLDPVYEEKIIGHAEVRQIFKASGVGTIAGCYVLDGKFTRNASVRISRDGTITYDGAIEALKRFKDDVKEVNAGYECGLSFTKFNDIKEGDKIEAYIMQEVTR